MPTHNVRVFAEAHDTVQDIKTKLSQTLEHNGASGARVSDQVRKHDFN